MKTVVKFLDDILLVIGCGCILVGLGMWSAMATWIAGGVMLIGFGYLVGKRMAKNVID